MLRSVIFLLINCLALALALSPARAQEKPESDAKEKPAPDTAKVSAADEAALRAALKALAKGLQDGDGKAIKHAIYATTPTERKMVDAMSEMAVQIAALHKASVKAFGEEQARDLTGEMGSEMSRIDEATIWIEGDTATVRYDKEKTDAQPQPPPTEPDDSQEKPKAPDPPDPAAPPKDPVAQPADDTDETAPPAPPLVLKKVDGRWQVPVSELSKDTTQEEIEQRLTDLDVQTKVIAELSGEITQGKYKSADEAAEAWQAKMMQSLTPRRKAPPPDKQEKQEKEEPKSEEKPKPSE